MKIGSTIYTVTVKSNGDVIDNFRDPSVNFTETDIDIINVIKQFYNDIRGNANTAYRDNVLKNYRDKSDIFANLFTATVADAVESAPIPAEDILVEGINDIMKFFTEFNFEPNYRFMNTLSHYLDKSDSAGKGYINRYFELINSPYANAIVEKVKSQEFKAILGKLSAVKPNKVVNNRFKIYYGSQGTGKTTQALKESNGKCIVCHSAMLPSDLMEDFKFDAEGHAQFVPSELWRAMVEGRVITLDEINLLPFESLRFLQGILDGKESLIYKGQEVKIADGFMIIGTMNLTVNGMTYGLPEPLIDRCAETRKFNLTAENLKSAIL